MPTDAVSATFNDRLYVDDSGTDYNSSGSGRSVDSKNLHPHSHSSAHSHSHHHTSQGSHSHTQQTSISGSNSSTEGQSSNRPERLEFQAKTVRELLERMSKVKVRVSDKKGGLIPFIEPICPGHPFADLFPSSTRSPKEHSSHPTSGYDVEDSSSS